MSEIIQAIEQDETQPLLDPRHWVRAKDRACRLTTGPNGVQQAKEDGFKEVTGREQSLFMAETKKRYGGRASKLAGFKKV